MNPAAVGIHPNIGFFKGAQPLRRPKLGARAVYAGVANVPENIARGFKQKSEDVVLAEYNFKARPRNLGAKLVESIVAYRRMPEF